MTGRSHRNPHCTNENLIFIKKIVSSATVINEVVLNRMLEYVGINCNVLLADGQGLASWPEDVVLHNSSVWVYDFPWVDIKRKDFSHIDKEHDMKVFMLDGSRNTFLSSKAFRWLVDVLKESSSHEGYFGSITQKLHDALSDDPRPYRKDVKQLLTNLLSYCKEYAKEYVLIDVPGSHSERVRLIKDF